MDTVRDRLWLFSVEAGTDDTHFGVPISRITPIEAAFYLHVPNVIMVTTKQGPYPPLDPYLRAMRPLKNVVWSIVGSGGRTGWAEGREVEMLRELAGRFPNLTGVFMDDFFREAETPDAVGVLGLDELRAIRDQLVLPDRRLDLWVVLYTHQLDLPVREHLALCDVVTLWTWHARELDRLEENLVRLEERAPDRRRMLGLYMWDYGDKRPMPRELMEHQCAVGLKWLQEGKIDGLIFLGSYLCDLDLEAVEWTRKWIAQVGASPVTGSTR